MKRLIHSLRLIALTLCLLLSLIACTVQPGQELLDSAQTDTSAPAETGSSADSEAPSESQTDAPVSGEIDYYPGMSYVKTETLIAVEGFDTALLGQVVDPPVAPFPPM